MAADLDRIAVDHLDDRTRPEPARTLPGFVDDIVQREELAQARRGLRRGEPTEGAELGGEAHLAVNGLKVQRLDAEGVAHEPGAAVDADQAEGEHAA